MVVGSWMVSAYTHPRINHSIQSYITYIIYNNKCLCYTILSLWLLIKKKKEELEYDYKGSLSVSELYKYI